MRCSTSGPSFPPCPGCRRVTRPSKEFRLTARPDLATNGEVPDRDAEVGEHIERNHRLMCMRTELIQVVEDDSLERSGRCLTHHPLKLGALANSAPRSTDRTAFDRPGQPGGRHGGGQS